MTDNSKTFAFVCDGEVAYKLRIPMETEHLIAVLSSNPTIVELENENDADMGDLYTNGGFVKP